MNLHKTILLLVFAAMLLTAGCGPAKDPYAPVISTPQRAAGKILGYSIQHRPIELITMGTGPQTVLIISTIHGNEDAGTPLVRQLISHLKRRPRLLNSHTILIVPVVNPDGRAQRTRGNAAGVDLNRNFPSDNRINNNYYGIRGLTEPESQILHDLIISHKPVRIVTLHQPLACLDYDGPAAELTHSMRLYCTLPVNKLGARPGSLGSFAGVDQSIPIVTMELKGSDSALSANELWAQYGTALMAFITYPQSPY